MSWFSRKTWYPKLFCLILAVVYFAVITAVHDSPYIWLTLTLIVILCLSTFACKTEAPILRFSNGPYTADQTGENEGNNEANEEGAPPIWMTDVPPSYSFIMESMPPPSYGSAIVMFTGNSSENAKSENTKKETATPVSSPMLRQLFDRRMLFRSVSRQFSVENARRQMSRQASEITTNGEDLSGIIIIARPRSRRVSGEPDDDDLSGIAFTAKPKQEEPHHSEVEDPSKIVECPVVINVTPPEDNKQEHQPP